MQVNMPTAVSRSEGYERRQWQKLGGGMATTCILLAKTFLIMKSSFPHNRPPATRLRQCRTVQGLITNVFGQQPVPSHRFLFGLTWRGDFARARILRFFVIALWIHQNPLL